MLYLKKTVCSTIIFDDVCFAPNVRILKEILEFKMLISLERTVGHNIFTKFLTKHNAYTECHVKKTEPSLIAKYTPEV